VLLGRSSSIYTILVKNYLDLDKFNAEPLLSVLEGRRIGYVHITNLAEAICKFQNCNSNGPQIFLCLVIIEPFNEDLR
jgi:hypothetical protein